MIFPAPTATGRADGYHGKVSRGGSPRPAAPSISALPRRGAEDARPVLKPTSDLGNHVLPGSGRPHLPSIIARCIMVLPRHSIQGRAARPQAGAVASAGIYRGAGRPHLKYPIRSLRYPISHTPNLDAISYDATMAYRVDVAVPKGVFLPPPYGTSPR